MRAAIRFPRQMFLASAGVLALGFAVYAGLWRCPTALFFRIPCPACGSVRAIRGMLIGDWPVVVRMNPIAPLMVVFLGLLVGRGIWDIGQHGERAELLRGSFANALFFCTMILTTFEIVIWCARFAGFLGGPVPI